MDSIADIHATIKPIVLEAGEIARRWFGKSDIVRIKPGFDPVTQADEEIDKFIRDSISSIYDHGFITEENADHAADADFVWIVDPIDGTKYFAREIPLYSICLALNYRGQTVLGMVYDPQSDQFYDAHNGCAWLNERPIQVSSITALDQCIVGVEFPSREFGQEICSRALRDLGILNQKCARARILNASGLDLAYCASGGFDAYARLGFPTKAWDVTAGFFLVEQAGGVIMHEESSGRIFGGPENICEKLAAVLS